MWLIGIAPQDMIHAGSLLGQKIIMTEFIGYVDLANLKAAGAFAQTKSVIMCTYFLCGFANFASIGIQIGGIGGLTPKNKPLAGSVRNAGIVSRHTRFFIIGYCCRNDYRLSFF